MVQVLQARLTFGMIFWQISSLFHFDLKSKFMSDSFSLICKSLILTILKVKNHKKRLTQEF